MKQPEQLHALELIDGTEQPAPTPEVDPSTQLDWLPGTTFEDIFQDAA